MNHEFTPHMSQQEQALLIRHIPPKGNVLEFGCGGSTQLFLESGVVSLYSVDSSIAWLEKLLLNPVIRINMKHGVWVPLYADIGPIGEWGKPLQQTPDKRWLNYHETCWRDIPSAPFDMVLIDGRFRVACLCQYLLRYGSRNTVIAFHDFWDREQYHGVLQFLEVKDRADTLAIFTVKENIDQAPLKALLAQHMFIYE